MVFFVSSAEVLEELTGNGRRAIRDMLDFASDGMSEKWSYNRAVLRLVTVLR